MEHSEVVEIVSGWFKSDPNVILVRKGSGEFPDPDIEVQFKNATIGFVECKPSNAKGREYLTGFGQAIAYATLSHYSFLALPEKEMNEFKKYFWVDSVGLLSVSPSGNVKLVRKPAKHKPLLLYEKRTRAYGYYRDLHPEEIHKILEAISYAKNETARKNKIWSTICRIRKIKSQRQKNAWILNIKLLLRDLGLTNYDLSLTDKGFFLLQLGRLKNKKPYLTELTKCFLFNANYISLLALMQKLNDEYGSFSTIDHFKNLLKNGIIKEKLATPQTNVIRDLQDILRILKELELIGKWSKYKYTINWHKIVELLK